MDENNAPKRRGRPKGSKDLVPRKQRSDIGVMKGVVKRETKEEPGQNSKYLNHALEVLAMPPIEIKDVKQVEQRIWEYYELCAANDVKPSSTGFRNALGISRQTLSDWRLGKYRAGTHQAVVCKGYDMLEALWEDYMQNGKINPVAGIFLGKNLYGYTDQKEVVVTPNTGPVEAVDPDVIEAKYDELPGE